ASSRARRTSPASSAQRAFARGVCGCSGEATADGNFPFFAIRGAHLTPTLLEGKRMADTSELIEFRRAFVWLLCGMLLPSVALVDLVPRLAGARFPRERAAFRVAAPREPVPPLIALRRIVAEAGQTATVVARIPLGPPLEGFALAAELPGDPAAPLAFRNRTLYIALLVLLYGGIGVGFGLTIREMRRAYKLSRLKTDFVANISHELRTPLTSVRLFAETLRQGRAVGPEEVKECVELLSAEAERLSK